MASLPLGQGSLGVVPCFQKIEWNSNVVIASGHYNSEDHYHHPSVSQLAFRNLNHEQMLQIEVIHHPDMPKDINSRLFRTCLSLLETLHRYGWGVVTNYKKRVIHDCLIPRDTYQDLYLVMRERHKHLIDTWQEVTDHSNMCLRLFLSLVLLFLHLNAN